MSPEVVSVLTSKGFLLGLLTAVVPPLVAALDIPALAAFATPEVLAAFATLGIAIITVRAQTTKPITQRRKPDPVDVESIIGQTPRPAAPLPAPVVTPKPAAPPGPPESPVNTQEQTFIFIVNGEDVPISSAASSPLATARNKALAESHNTGRPPDEWEIRNELGQLLAAEATVESFHFPRKVRLFLTLHVGAGG